MKFLRIILLLALPFCLFSETIDAKKIVEEMDSKARGESNISEMTMKIVRPDWERSVSMVNWSLGRDYYIVYITAPAKEKGQVFLKRENQIWNFVPSINRLIKLPPSMMGNSWMGSDFTNDDLVKESSVVHDYEHKHVATEKVDGKDCYKIEMIPKRDAAVVWGKVLMWVSVENKNQLKVEYYDEDGELVNTMYGKSEQDMDGRYIPTVLEMIPADEEGNKTVLILDKVEFDVDIDKSFFSQKNIKRIRP